MDLILRRIPKFKSEILFFDNRRTNCLKLLRCCSSESVETNKSEVKEFRELNLYPSKRRERRKREFRKVVTPPRTTKMTPEQDWASVWPGPRTFHPATVPLPLWQGINKSGPPPDKYGNAELMKIPNFLHLTPPAIQKHCEALKQFCTNWPKNLDTEEDIEKHFPVKIIYSDYCHSSSSIRDPKSRIISLKIKLSSLKFDEHSKDKFMRLIGPRYDPKTDLVTITTDSCPLKKQNYDYAYYLLTAAYFESWKTEEWEKLKSAEDMEKYIFSERKSFEKVKAVFEYNKKDLPNLEEFGKVIEDWHNNGDDLTVIENYKKAAMKLLSLPPLEPST